MKNRHTFLLLTFLLAYSTIARAQGSRRVTKEAVGWYTIAGTFPLSKKFELHTEYQWRRTGLITNWQQSLLRLGLNCLLSSSILLRAGYAWAETFAYGDIPINAFGKSFTEHRIFEMVQLSHKEGAVEFVHRYMLEQRFVGKYSSANAAKEDSYPLLNRMRYMLRMQAPLQGREIPPKVTYLALFDEVMIGFGKNVGVNIFDQNRLGLLFGYGVAKHIKVEAGYLNQILQLGRLVNGQHVFQNNKGILINTSFKF